MERRINQNFIIGVVIAVILVFGLIIGWVILQKEKAPEEEITEEETPPLTGKEIEEQLEELDALRQQSGQKAATEEEIQKQLEELDNLRAKSAP